MIEALIWHASPDLLTAGHHQGELVTMIEVLSWQVAPGLLTGSIEAPTLPGPPQP